MIARFSVATLRRLEQLERPAQLTVGSNAGLLVVPRILSLGEWEIAAHAWHRRLLLLDEEERGRSPPIDRSPEPPRPPASYVVYR